LSSVVTVKSVQSLCMSASMDFEPMDVSDVETPTLPDKSAKPLPVLDTALSFHQSPVDHQHEMDENHEIHETLTPAVSGSPSQCRALYSTNTSLNSSVNLSTSLLEFHDQTDSANALQTAMCALRELRAEYLHEIKQQMSTFKNGLALWNEGGFIPLLGNFMSWISEADREIKALSHRIECDTRCVQTVAVRLQKQRRTLQHRTKQLHDCQFENDALRQENEWLRQQMLVITGTMADSQRQMTVLEQKHQRREERLIEKLEDLDNVDAMDQDNAVENVTIFKKLESPPKRAGRAGIRRGRGRGHSVSTRTRKRTPTAQRREGRMGSVKRLKRMETADGGSDELENKGPRPKAVVSRSRSVRHSKRRETRTRTDSHKRERSRRRSAPRCNVMASTKEDVQNGEESTFTTSTQERKGLSAIRRPSASVRRLSMHSGSRPAS